MQKEVTDVLGEVNKRLGGASFLVGNRVTLADIGVWAAIKCMLLSLVRVFYRVSYLRLSFLTVKRPSPLLGDLPNVQKWLAALDALPEFASVKDQIPAEESQQKHDKSSGKYPPLPNAVVRLAPAP